MNQNSTDHALQAFVKRWKRVGPLLEEIRDHELCSLSPEEARKRIQAVLMYDPCCIYIPPHRQSSSGLVEQQAFFKKAVR